MTREAPQTTEVEVCPDLVDILSYRRRHGSAGELEMIEKYIAPITDDTLTDDAGNPLAYVVYVRADENPETLFTSHTDSVDNDKRKGRREVLVSKNGTLRARDDILSADDGAGIWLMLRMIEAQVPGTYIFFRGEECGGIGSRGSAERYPEFFRQFKRAVAFDRKGTWSIITHQGMGRCCSDAFADELALRLTVQIDQDYFFDKDDGGIYTDTAELTHLIPECTNLSVGYDAQHTQQESLNYPFLLALLDAVALVDWHTLPTERKVTDRDEYDYGVSFLADWREKSTSTKRYKYEPVPSVADVASWSYDEIIDWVDGADPYDVAELIYDLARRH